MRASILALSLFLISASLLDLALTAKASTREGFQELNPLAERTIEQLDWTNALARKLLHVFFVILTALAAEYTSAQGTRRMLTVTLAFQAILLATVNALSVYQLAGT